MLSDAGRRIELRPIEAYFNPITRLFAVRMMVRAAGAARAITGRLDGPDLANAWVLCVPHNADAAELTADGVVPADVDPTQLAILIEVEGVPALRLPMPTLTEERAGLIAARVEGGRLRVDAWAAAARASLRLGAHDVVPAAKGPSAAFAAGRVERLHAEAPWPLAEPHIAIDPEGAGGGQSLAGVAAWLSERRVTSPRLAGLRDAHAGETAWIVGNGPSVRPADLDRLEGRLSFAFNRFHLAYDRTRFRPTYTISGDQQMIDDFGQDIVDRAGGTIVLARETLPDAIGDYCWVRQISFTPPLFSMDPARLVVPGGSSLYVALQLGYWMGIRRFYLYGTDFHFRFARVAQAEDPFRSVAGDDNHFIPNYRAGRPWCPPSFRNIAAAFLNARVLMEGEGGFIRNATHGGLLDIFPRAGFEAALADG